MSRLFLCFAFALGVLSFPSTPVAADIIPLGAKTPFRAAYLATDTQQKTLRVDVYMLIGEADFTGAEGRSHYLEHLIASSTMDFEDGRLRHTQGNAFATPVLTNYNNQGEADTLDDMLDQAVQVFQPPRSSPNFMTQERNVVLREYDLRMAEYPTRQANRELRKVIMGAHPLGRDVMGRPADIRDFTPQQALADHRRLYHPANAVLLISGPPSLGEDSALQDKVETAFAKVPAGPAYQRDWPTWQPTDQAPYIASVTDPSVSLNAIETWAVLKRDKTLSSPEFYVLHLLLNVWQSSRLSGSLEKQLVSEEGLVQSHYFIMQPEDRDLVMLYRGARFGDDKAHAMVSKRMAETLRDLADKGMDASTLKRLKKRMRRELKRSYKRADFKARLLLTMHTMQPEPEAEVLQLETYLAALDALTKSQVDAMLRSLAYDATSGELHISAE